MTQAALFEPAPVSLTPSTDDPLIEEIKRFSTRAEAFNSNLTGVIDEYLDDTLYDAMQAREGAGYIADIIGVLSKSRTALFERSQLIIDDCQAAGHIKEGNLEIVSKESQGRRSVDRDLLIKERKDVFDLLLNTKIEAVKIDYTPTIADLKTILKKRHEAYLKPGEITVTYDIEILMDGEDQ